MLAQIQSILNGIADFITNIGNIITIIWNGMLDIPKLLYNSIQWTNSVLSWAFPVGIVSILSIILSVVVIYKIFGRT